MPRKLAREQARRRAPLRVQPRLALERRVAALEAHVARSKGKKEKAKERGKEKDKAATGEPAQKERGGRARDKGSSAQLPAAKEQSAAKDKASTGSQLREKSRSTSANRGGKQRKRVPRSGVLKVAGSSTGVRKRSASVDSIAAAMRTSNLSPGMLSMLPRAPASTLSAPRRTALPPAGDGRTHGSAVTLLSSSDKSDVSAQPLRRKSFETRPSADMSIDDPDAEFSAEPPSDDDDTEDSSDSASNNSSRQASVGYRGKVARAAERGGKSGSKARVGRRRAPQLSVRCAQEDVNAWKRLVEMRNESEIDTLRWLLAVGFAAAESEGGAPLTAPNSSAQSSSSSLKAPQLVDPLAGEEKEEWEFEKLEKPAAGASAEQQQQPSLLSSFSLLTSRTRDALTRRRAQSND